MLKFLLLIIAIIFIPLAYADVTELHILPENPIQGDTITISGKASPDELINIIVSYDKTLTTSEGKYLYCIDGIKIPPKPNSFKVIAEGVENLNIRVKLLFWWTGSADASAGTATISHSNMLPGTYKAQIDGVPTAGTSTVVLKITGEQTIEADHNGNFECSYITDVFPTGEFIVHAGGLSKTIYLSTPQSESSGESPEGSGESPGMVTPQFEGSGGSPGMVTSQEAFENILISETKRKNVVKDYEVSYSFDLEGNIIRYLNFTGLSNLGMVPVKVEILKNRSTLVEHAPSNIVYKDLNILVENSDPVISNNIANSTVKFRVEKSWIAEKCIEEATLRLNLYNNGKWNSLVTERIDEDTDYLYFKAYTPGFSQFAITGKAVQPSTGQSTIPEPGGENLIRQTEQEEPVTTPTIGNPGFEIIIGVIGMLIAVIINLRKN